MNLMQNPIRRNLVIQQGYFARVKWLTFWFQLLSLILVLFLNIEALTNTTLYFSLLLIALTFLSNILIQKLTKGESYLLLITNMLFSIGVVMIYRLNPNLGSRQLLFYSVGVVIFFITYFILKYTGHFWKDKALVFYLLTVALLGVTLFFGKTLGGATNWFVIFGVQVQPGEFAKISYAFFVASLFTLKDEKRKEWVSYILMIATYILIGIFLLQRELGFAAIFYVTMLCAQIAFSKKRIPILLNLVLIVIGLYLAYQLFGHVKVRFDIWIDPWTDMDGTGYQITQSLFAVASGGLFGQGIGLGSPGSIPLAYSDFIFPSIVEEMGIFMGIGILLLYLILFYRGLKISLFQRDYFYRVLSLSIAMMFAAQAFIVVGGVLKVIPLTGLTLPFMAHGGSSLLTSFCLMGVLQFCSEDHTDTEEVYHEEQ